VKLAVVVPAVVAKVPWPMLVVPSEKLAVPVGLATAVLPGVLTDIVTVNVTACPDTDGFTEDAMTEPVLALPTVSATLPALL
jgi:hypothetical protein